MPTKAITRPSNGHLSTSPSQKSTYQSKLFSSPSKSKSSETDEPLPPNKRQKVEVDGEAKGKPATTTNDRELVPVTNENFVNRYKVEGLQDIYYQRDWIDAKTAHRWHSELQDLKEWYRPKLKVYGREIQQSRSIAGLELKYSGHQVEMHAPFPPVLERIASILSTDECLGSDVKFNHAMLNCYENGQVYIGKHSDNLENKVIVTVSLGAPRTWIMEEKKPRGSTEKGPRHKWILETGSLLVMQGSVQKTYTHEIPKEPKVKESRISITFRQLVY